MGVIFLCLAGLLALLFTPLPEWLANRTIDLFLEGPLGLEIQIGDIGGDLYRNLSLREVQVFFDGGQGRVQLPGIYLQYDWRKLVRRQWRLQEVLLQGPVIFWPQPDKESSAKAASEPLTADQIVPAIPAFEVDRLTISGGRLESSSGVQVDSLDVELLVHAKQEQLHLQVVRCQLVVPCRKLAVKGLSTDLIFSRGTVQLARLQAETDKSRLGISGRIVLFPAFSCSLGVWANSLCMDELSLALGLEKFPEGDLMLNARVQGDSISCQGHVQIRGRVGGYDIHELSSNFSWWEDKLELDYLSLRSPGIIMQGRGYLQTGKDDPGFWADLALRQVDLSAITGGGPPSQLTGRLVASGRNLSPQTLRATADVDLEEGAVAGRAFQSIRGQIRFDRGLWTVDQGLELDLEGAHIFLVGSLDDGQHLDAWAEVEVEDVGWLLNRSQMSGALQARFRALGPLSDPVLAGQLKLSDLRQGAGELKEARGSFGLRGAMSRDEGFFALRFFHGEAGRVIIDRGLARGRFTGQQIYLDSLSLESHQGQMAAAGRINFVEGQVTARVDTLWGDYGGYGLFSSRPMELFYGNGILRLEESQLILEAGSISLQGTVGPGSRIQGMARLQDVRLELISHLLPTGHLLSGPVSLDVALEGSTKDPLGQASFCWEEGSFDQVTFDRISTQMAYADGRLTVEEFQARRGDSVFRGEGYLPIDLKKGKLLTGEAWDLAISGEGSSPGLLSLLVKEIEDIQGPFALRFKASGTVNQPRYEGFFNLTEGTLRLASMGNSIQNLEIQINLDGPYLVIDRIEGETPIRERNWFKRLWVKYFGAQRRGRFGISGRIDLTGPAFDLAMRADGLFVDYPAEMIEAELDANLRVRGQKVPQLSGEIDLVRFLYAKDLSSTSPVSTAEEPPAYGLDLTVQIPKNCWVRNEAANIEMQGKLRVLQQEGQLGLLGELETIRGTYSLYRNNFNIDQGKVIFDDLAEINPLLNVVAWTEVDQERIELTIADRLHSPTIQLTSSSGYGEGDIIALLTFRQSTAGLDTLSAKQLAYSQALGYFGNYLHEAVNRKASGTLGVDKFTLDPVSSGELNLEEIQLTVGAYLSSNIYVEYTRNLSQQSGEQVGVEYSLTRNLSLRGNRDEKGLYRMGLSLEWNY